MRDIIVWNCLIDRWKRCSVLLAYFSLLSLSLLLSICCIGRNLYHSRVKQLNFNSDGVRGGCFSCLLSYTHDMMREGKKRLRRALSAPSPRAILSALRNHNEKAVDRQSLLCRSRFYLDDEDDGDDTQVAMGLS